MFSPMDIAKRAVKAWTTEESFKELEQSLENAATRLNKNTFQKIWKCITLGKE